MSESSPLLRKPRFSERNAGVPPAGPQASRACAPIGGGRPPGQPPRRRRSGVDSSSARRLVDWTPRIVLLVTITALAPAAFACPVCFGAPDDPMVKGVNNGIWVLLGLVAFVQVGFAAMFYGFWRRAKARQRFRESFHIVQSHDGGGPES